MLCYPSQGFPSIEKTGGLRIRGPDLNSLARLFLLMNALLLVFFFLFYLLPCENNGANARMAS